jgi:uncharacterized protein YjbI with pentapeptide repeats
MKASEVLRRYAAGDRDFRRTDLRGQSFKGRDLSGANFSEADIRGVSFVRANLQKADFTRAKAGIQTRYLITRLALAAWFPIIISFTSASLSRALVERVSALNEIKPYAVIPSILMLFINAIVVFLVACQGFTAKISKTISLIGLCVGLVIISGNQTIADIIFVISTILALISAMITCMVGSASIYLDNISSSFSLTSTPKTFIVVIIGVGILAAVFAGSGTMALHIIAIYVLKGNSKSVTLERFSDSENFLAISAIPVAALSLYVISQVAEKSEEFAVIRKAVLGLAAMGGTSFRYTDLTGAIFVESNLQNADFRYAKLTHVLWSHIKNLEVAQISNSILVDSDVQDLLITRNGNKKSYTNAILQGANLDGISLIQANLTRANLSGATLHHADLSDADLSETLVVGADFTEASLTGACLQSWNIDHTTNLEGVDCQYVYLLRDQQERRPSSGDFAPGEFTKLFQEVLSTVDLIFRNGVDWKAFVAAFKQVQVENEDTPLEIQSIENKGDEVVVVRVTVPPEADKTKIHSEFNQQYELLKAKLQASESEVTIYREQSANLWGVINSLAKQPINVNVTAEAKTMNDSTDSSRKIEIGNIGGNFSASGQALNLGDISGTVTNTINQLPDDAAPNQPNLKELLTQLQAAIETDTSLPDADKADLLEQVQHLAEAKQTAEPAQKEGLARKAKKMFDATLKNLPDTAKIAEACSKLLPLILKALGVPVP